MAKAAVKKPPTKTQIISNIAEATGLAKKDVAAVFDALAAEIKKSLKPKEGAFTIPGLVKIGKKKVKPRAAKKNVPNPFKPGEFYDQPAKPGYTKVTVRALKNLKDMV
jgi:nucleoid DNA-binding protein